MSVPLANCPLEFVSVAQQLGSQKNLQPIGLKSNLIMGLRQCSAVVLVYTRWTGEKERWGHVHFLPSQAAARLNQTGA